MPTYDDYILNSEFATLSKVGVDVTDTITLPGSMPLASGAVYTTTKDVAIAGTGSFRAIISSSKIPGEYYPYSQFSVTRSWSGSSIGTVVIAYRLNPSTIRLELSAFNPYGVSRTSPAGDEVFTVTLSNMVLPF